MHARNAPDNFRCNEYASLGGGVSRCFSITFPSPATRRVMSRSAPKSYAPSAANGLPT